MIIRFLKSNNSSAFVLLPLIALSLWGFAFYSPIEVNLKNTMPLFELLAKPLSVFPWVGSFMSMCLIVAGAFILNYIVNQHEVLTKQSFLPALFYIVFLSSNHAMMGLHPILFANIFILFAINKILSSYRKDVAFSQVFDTGFLVSLASLFYFPCIVFLPLIGISFLLFRTFNWREWLISFVGVLVPYVFVITYYFWRDSLDYLFYDKMFFPIVFKRPTLELPQSFYFMITTGWVIVIFSFGKLFSGLGSGSQKTKKAMVLMLWLFAFSLLSLFLAPEIATKYFSLLAIPAAVICSNYFIRQKKELWGEILFVLFFASIVVNLIANIF